MSTMISHLNPASSKTKRNMESTNKRHIKLSQSVDEQNYFSVNVERKHKPSFTLQHKNDGAS